MTETRSDHTGEELLIAVIVRLLAGSRHIGVGVSSPIPGSAALLRQRLDGGRPRVSIIGSTMPGYRVDEGAGFFDCAAQGRLDAFFLSGGQIDGQANINLVGIGEDYPRLDVRWSGSFGSAFLYFMVPRVILFREEHSTRTLVPKVDFISAPGTSPPDVHRPGGPHALVTSRCLFLFDRDKGRFRLESVHDGHTVEEVRDNTGFDFDCPAEVPTTPPPEAGLLALLRGEVAGLVANPYPQFAARLWNAGQAA